jgi:hypothetical protein
MIEAGTFRPRFAERQQKESWKCDSFRFRLSSLLFSLYAGSGAPDEAGVKREVG